MTESDRIVLAAARRDADNYRDALMLLCQEQEELALDLSLEGSRRFYLMLRAGVRITEKLITLAAEIAQAETELERVERERSLALLRETAPARVWRAEYERAPVVDIEWDNLEGGRLLNYRRGFAGEEERREQSRRAPGDNFRERARERAEEGESGEH